MPFDSNPEQETIHAPFSLEDLIAWLETQPPDLTYDFGLPEVCLLGQYVQAKGGVYYHYEGQGTYELKGKMVVSTCPGLAEVGLIYIASGGNRNVRGQRRTMGDALIRARAQLANGHGGF